MTLMIGRRLGLATAAAVLAGCGFEVPNAGGTSGDARPIDGPGTVADSAIDAPVDAPAPQGCIDRMLVARKVYNPASTTDGQLPAAPPYIHLTVPVALEVWYGNAGNHCAELHFKNANNNLVGCRYQGGSSLPSPTSALDPIEIMNGLEYVFDRCVLGEACPSPNGTPVVISPGSSVQLSNDNTPITLHIDSGDSTPLYTEVRQTVRRCMQ
jgi:hypothetical protein